MSKIFITDYIKDPYIEKQILKKALSKTPHKDIEALLVWHEHINAEYMDQFPKLKGIVRYGVGYDSVDIKYANSRGIYVCNTPDYGIEEVRDATIAMIMNIIRGMTRYDFLCRGYKRTWQENTIKSIKRISDYTLGVIGAGRIGGSVILKANVLGFKTLFYDPYKERGWEKVLKAERVNSNEKLLKLADIVSIHTPLTSETRDMVDKDFVAKMKKGSSLINTARGKIVKDIDIFYKPLKSNRLSNVALDVLPNEPPKPSKLINAWRKRVEWLDGRLIINPHAAYYSGRAYIEMRQKAAINVLRIIKGLEPYNIIK